MKRNLLTLTLIILGFATFSQTITWTEITSENNLPDGIKLYKGERESPALEAWYMDIDLNQPDLAIRPYLGSKRTVPSMCAKVGAYAAINGGYFGGSTSYSAVVYPNEVQAQNVGAVTRNSLSYPVLRSMFCIYDDFTYSVDWVYHFGPKIMDIYTFADPLPYEYNDPTPKGKPQKTAGTQIENLLFALGGGPVLVKNGEKRITYNQEIFWGSGVGETNRDPRSSIGYTTDGHVIMFVADGRKSEISEGVNLDEMADLMLSFGCVEVMNLDGGGSSQLAINGEYVNDPSEHRAVPSVMAVTHIDSLGLPEPADYEEIIDTGDSNAQQNGSGWSDATAEGFWGDTPTKLAPRGNGENYYLFTFNSPADVYTEIYAWWSAAPNKCSDTPFIIKHKYKTDTVRIDQRNAYSEWVYIGKFVFNGDGSDFIKVTDEATSGASIAIDAIKLLSYSETNTGIKSFDKTGFDLQQNSPNPFSVSTNIGFSIQKRTNVKIEIYNTLGKKVMNVKNEMMNAGNHFVYIDAKNLDTGIYYYRLTIDGNVQTKKMLCIK